VVFFFHEGVDLSRRLEKVISTSIFYFNKHRKERIFSKSSELLSLDVDKHYYCITSCQNLAVHSSILTQIAGIADCVRTGPVSLFNGL